MSHPPFWTLRNTYVATFLSYKAHHVFLLKCIQLWFSITPFVGICHPPNSSLLSISSTSLLDVRLHKLEKIEVCIVHDTTVGKVVENSLRRRTRSVIRP